MGRAAAPSTGRRYGLARACRALEMPRSTVYAARARRLATVPPRKRGPKTAWTDEGVATVFIAVDHFTAECVGVHAARRGTRFGALEPLRQGIRQHFDGYREDIAAVLALRHDHRSQFMSDHFQTELRFLGIASSRAFVREPEGNGCAERFIRTLKEQLLWIKPFDSAEALRRALLAFKDRYNSEWLIERHGHQTPAAVRAAFAADAAA